VFFWALFGGVGWWTAAADAVLVVVVVVVVGVGVELLRCRVVLPLLEEPSKTSSPKVSVADVNLFQKLAMNVFLYWAAAAVSKVFRFTKKPKNQKRKDPPAWHPPKLPKIVGFTAIVLLNFLRSNQKNLYRAIFQLRGCIVLFACLAKSHICEKRTFLIEDNDNLSFFSSKIGSNRWITIFF
jgi:hypothetical protein